MLPTFSLASRQKARRRCRGTALRPAGEGFTRPFPSPPACATTPPMSASASAPRPAPAPFPGDPRITPELVRSHKLSPDEYTRIEAHLGRAPTYAELGVLSVMWS